MHMDVIVIDDTNYHDINNLMISTYFSDEEFILVNIMEIKICNNATRFHYLFKKKTHTKNNNRKTKIKNNVMVCNCDPLQSTKMTSNSADNIIFSLQANS